MNAVITAEATASATNITVDPRLAWMAVVAAEHTAVEVGAQSIDRGYTVAVRAHIHWFGSPAECDVCGTAPCSAPTFCAACRAADQKRGRR